MKRLGRTIRNWLLGVMVVLVSLFLGGAAFMALTLVVEHPAQQRCDSLIGADSAAVIRVNGPPSQRWEPGEYECPSWFRACPTSASSTVVWGYQGVIDTTWLYFFTTEGKVLACEPVGS